MADGGDAWRWKGVKKRHASCKYSADTGISEQHSPPTIHKTLHVGRMS